MIKTVTITGADNSVDPKDLVKISQEFPFVEWGILASRNNFGTPRFPSGGWIVDLGKEKSIHENLKLSTHLCGGMVREFAKGQMGFMSGDDVGDLIGMSQRVQINFHGDPHEWKAAPVGEFVMGNSPQEFIFQYDNVNTDLLEALVKMGVKNIAALFDVSHGAGILPEDWPKHLDFVKCGYAGGLGPDNLEDQIKKILKSSGHKDIWIDMETKVRSNDDKNFDLDKVRKCLEIAKPWTE